MMNSIRNWLGGSHSAEKTLEPVSFPVGIKVWHEPQNAAYDICFIHGLTGDRESTWTADGRPLPWPKTLLPNDFERARILTYGYDAYSLKQSAFSRNKVIDHAANFLHDLTNNRDSQKMSLRPLIIIAHSSGGIVCKKSILLSGNKNKKHRFGGIFHCLKGVIFMGTPHKGSWVADWKRIPVNALGVVKSSNAYLLDILGGESELLEDIRVSFSSMVRQLRDNGRNLRTFCFYEEFPVPGFTTIVSKDSATFDDESSDGIYADHIGMVKFAAASDSGYERLREELRDWEKEIFSGGEHVIPPPLGSSRSLENL